MKLFDATLRDEGNVGGWWLYMVVKSFLSETPTAISGRAIHRTVALLNFVVIIP